MTNNEKELQDLIAKLEQHGLGNGESANEARLLLEAEYAINSGNHTLFNAIHKTIANVRKQSR